MGCGGDVDPHKTWPYPLISIGSSPIIDSCTSPLMLIRRVPIGEDTRQSRSRIAGTKNESDVETSLASYQRPKECSCAQHTTSLPHTLTCQGASSAALARRKEKKGRGERLEGAWTISARLAKQPRSLATLHQACSRTRAVTCGRAPPHPHSLLQLCSRLGSTHRPHQ